MASVADRRQLRFDLDVRLDARAAAGDETPAALSVPSRQWRARIYERLGLKAHSGAAWVSLDLESPKGWQAVGKVIEECRAGRLEVGAAIAREKPPVDGDWHVLQTGAAYDSFSLWDDYPGYRAGTHPEGHALNETFVSEAFVDIAKKARLRGISFLRCQNKGRKAVPAWFAALPTQPLGLGLDHPWFDRQRWLREVAGDAKKRSLPLHCGQSQFHQCWLRDDCGADTGFIARLLELCPMPRERVPLQGLEFVTVPRYWSGALPDTDFAYLPFGEDGPNREGKVLRFRKLAVSRRGRKALLAAGLFDAKAFRALRTVTTPEPGVELLDARHEPIPPMYTLEELAALRAREAALPGAPARRRK
ncbi:MAG TPA: hypothetical protein VFP62_05465 [Burkholderiales bacterium]|nr:hypothetical protein [Burkholderiales bacterium]